MWLNFEEDTIPEGFTEIQKKHIKVAYIAGVADTILGLYDGLEEAEKAVSKFLEDL